MTMWKALLMAAALLGALMPGAAIAQDQAQEEVRILVPAFSGEATLGRTTSNLLRLQVSQTFQVAGTPTRAMMVFRDKPLPFPDHESAMAAGLQLGALSHLVLWGTSYDYPDGTVVETHLSTTPWLYEGRPDRPELWVLRVPQTDIALSSELPRVVYEFPSIVLTAEAARHYQDMDGLTIYSDRQFTHAVGHFKDIYRAHRYELDAVYLTSGNVTGYVPLPHLYDARNETTVFVGGYIRMLRGDWPGAAQLFGEVLAQPEITPEVEIDSHLFVGLCEEKTGRSGLAEFTRAVALNPYDRAAVSYLLMGRLSAALRAPAPARATALAKLRADIAAHSSLFNDGSEWMKMLNRAADALPT